MSEISTAPSPTHEFYGMLSTAFDHFNRQLFAGQLPDCLLTVQRETNTMGYFSPERWGNSRGEKAHEIAINPAYFASHTLIEVLQTLVHEQCHLWQQVYGSRKSRTAYHNREWAGKMESIGLMPSQSGAPGGKKTGQQMSDYPLAGGLFLQACQALVSSGYQLSWVDRIPAVNESRQIRNESLSNSTGSEGSEVEVILTTRLQTLLPEMLSQTPLLETKLKKNKTKYTCPGCDTNVWGKPELQISCDSCRQPFGQVD